MSSPTATQAEIAAAHPYTCNTCQVAYRNADLQKGHMKSDWHRYNLKRRVASLPPITAEAFSEKVLQARAQTTAEADKAFFERVCEACEKTYYSENSFQNHLLSQKHRAREARGPRAPGIPDEASSVMSSTFTLGDPIRKGEDAESLDSSVEEEFNQIVEGMQKTNVSQNTRPSPVKRPSNPQASVVHGESSDKERDSNTATPTPPMPDAATLVLQCIFCRYTSSSVRHNAHHMERFHGMVIPEKDYLVDLEGLIRHLCARVYEDLECLSCGKSKANAFAVQTHMRDIGHCTIPFTTESEQLDIGDYYDFRSTYSDDEDDEDDDEDEDGEVADKKERRSKRAAKDGEDEGWETDSSASSVDSDELASGRAGDRQTQKQGLRAVYHDETELYLPSGKSVGHRSMNKYFRQNLHNYPTPEEREEQQRLAIENGEAAEDGEEGEEGEEGEDGKKARSRAVVPRDQGGIQGLADEKKQVLRRDVEKGRDAARTRYGKKFLAVGMKANNQKSYYYRYDGGG